MWCYISPLQPTGKQFLILGLCNYRWICSCSWYKAVDEMALRLIGFIFLFGMGETNKLCIRGHASKNKPDWLPLHIHVSPSRFIASWHNVRTINVSYVAQLSHYRDSLTCCSFKYKNVHSASKQDILGLWVPSIERRWCVLSITCAEKQRLSAVAVGVYSPITLSGKSRGI